MVDQLGGQEAAPKSQSRPSRSMRIESVAAWPVFRSGGSQSLYSRPSILHNRYGKSDTSFTSRVGKVSTSQRTATTLGDRFKLTKTFALILDGRLCGSGAGISGRTRGAAGPHPDCTSQDARSLLVDSDRTDRALVPLSMLGVFVHGRLHALQAVTKTSVPLVSQPVRPSLKGYGSQL